MQAAPQHRSAATVRCRLVLAVALVALPLSALPRLYHYVTCPFQSPPGCQACLHGSSATDAPDSRSSISAQIEPVGLIFAHAPDRAESVPAVPHGGRSPPPLD